MRFSRLHGETLGDMIFVVPSVLTATAHTGTLLKLTLSYKIKLGLWQ